MTTSQAWVLHCKYNDYIVSIISTSRVLGKTRRVVRKPWFLRAFSSVGSLADSRNRSDEFTQRMSTARPQGSCHGHVADVSLMDQTQSILSPQWHTYSLQMVSQRLTSTKTTTSGSTKRMWDNGNARSTMYTTASRPHRLVDGTNRHQKVAGAHPAPRPDTIADVVVSGARSSYLCNLFTRPANVQKDASGLA
jgi:hypothetical protein